MPSETAGLTRLGMKLISTRQILEAKNLKKALETHITTVKALSDLYVEELFLDHLYLKRPCIEAEQQLCQSCVQHLQQDMLKAQQNMLPILDSQRVLKMNAQFDKKRSQSTMLQVCTDLHENGII